MKKYDYKQIEKLVIKAQSGDNEAFEELYSTTYKNVYFYVLSILKDDTLAEDISQDVFLIVMKSINDLKNPKLFIAWVKKIAYNRCIQEINSSKKLAYCNYEDTLKNDTLSEVDNVIEHTYEKKEKHTYLVSLIDKLSLQHKNLILFKYYEGLKSEEIAFIMDMPLGTVKSGLHYAKKKLKSMYLSDNFYGMIFIPSISKSLNIHYYNTAKNITVPALAKGTYLSQNAAASTNYLGGSSKINIGNKFKFVAVSSTIVTSGILLTTIGINPNIKSISYNDSKYINKDLELEITLNHSAFLDEIYILDSNGNKIYSSKSKHNKVSAVITENGSYEIYTKSIFNKTNKKDIDVNCIDKTKPQIIDYKYNEEEILINVTDDLSNIDYKKTYITDVNGNKVEIFPSENINEIKLKTSKYNTDFTLYLYDKAGNLSKYLINIKFK